MAKQTLLDSIETHHVFFPEWRIQGRLKLKAEILKNERESYLSVTEYLLDDISFFLYIPEDHLSSGWSIFKRALLSSLSKQKEPHLHPIHHNHPTVMPFPLHNQPPKRKSTARRNLGQTLLLYQWDKGSNLCLH